MDNCFFGTSVAPTFSKQILKRREEDSTQMGLILLIILVLLLLGVVPSWPYSRNWGYGPSGGIGLILVIVLVLVLLRVF